VNAGVFEGSPLLKKGRLLLTPRAVTSVEHGVAVGPRGCRRRTIQRCQALRPDWRS